MLSHMKFPDHLKEFLEVHIAEEMILFSGPDRR